MSWIRTGWPSVILVMDVFRTENNENSFDLRQAVKTVTRTGCTTIFMGNFASTVVDLDDLDEFFANFPTDSSPTSWAHRGAKLIMEGTHTYRDPKGTSAFDFYPRIPTNALWLDCIKNREESVAYWAENMETCAVAERCGLGRVGCVGDVDLGGEAAIVVLGMCGIARDEGQDEEFITGNRISVSFRREE